LYEFEFEIFKYSCNLYLSNGVSWLKLADTKNPSLVSTGEIIWHQRFLTSPRADVYGVGYARTIDTINKFFSIGCVMTIDIKDESLTSSLMSIDSSRHKKYAFFYITQRVSDSLAGTKDRLPADTKNYFCGSEYFRDRWQPIRK
jgi:hypothetical protein